MEENKQPFSIKDGKVHFNQRLRLHPKTSDLLELCKATTFENLPNLLADILSQIALWREEEPEHFLVKNIQSDKETSSSELSKLENLISQIQKNIATKNYTSLAFNMYALGEAVGRLNHVEGWWLGLDTSINRSKGPQAAGKKSKEVSIARKVLLKEFAVAYFKMHPTHSKKNVVVAARASADLNVKNAANHYKVSFLSQIFYGCRDEALKSLGGN